MRVAIVCAGFTPGEADQLRSRMATFKHTGGVSEFRDKLITGMVANGYEREFAEKTFRQLEGFGSYGFPESHAASFALIAYASSWMKCWHPDVFCAALLNAQPMGFYAPAQIVRDARRTASRCGRSASTPLAGTARWSRRDDEGRFAVRLGMRMVPRSRQHRRCDDRRRPRGPAVRLGRRPLAPRRRAVSIAGPARRGRRLRTGAGAGAARSALGDQGAARRTAAALRGRRSARDEPVAEIEEPEVALRPMTAGERGGGGLRPCRADVAAAPGRLPARGSASTPDRHLRRRPCRPETGAGWRPPGSVLVRQRPGSAKGVHVHHA